MHIPSKFRLKHTDIAGSYSSIDVFYFPPSQYLTTCRPLVSKYNSDALVPGDKCIFSGTPPRVITSRGQARYRSARVREVVCIKNYTLVTSPDQAKSSEYLDRRNQSISPVFSCTCV